MINRAANALKENDNDEDNSQSKKLYFMAYELLGETEQEKEYLYRNQSFWRFRPNIDFNSMKVELINTTKPTEFILLKKFAEMVIIFID